MHDGSIDQLTEHVIGCAIAVHRELGPGLLESIYRDSLVLELRANDLEVAVEKRVPVFYRGVQLRDDLKVDIAVAGRLLVEVKCVERQHPVHTAQLLTYVKLTGYPAGLLLNFHQTTMRAGIKRVDHPDEYARKRARPVPKAE